jgi:hypothetical protein
MIESKSCRVVIRSIVLAVRSGQKTGPGKMGAAAAAAAAASVFGTDARDAMEEYVLPERTMRNSSPHWKLEETTRQETCPRVFRRGGSWVLASECWGCPQ